MKTIAIFNRENICDESLETFRRRRAVRGVVFDAEKNIALLHVVAKGYYGLPGGGVDSDESFEDGIVRELKEEVGCDIEIVSVLGRILEYRGKHNLVNESMGYVCHVIGEKGNPVLTGDENEDEKGSVVEWVTLEQAIRLMKEIPVQENIYDQYCLERDLAFLEETEEQQ